MQPQDLSADGVPHGHRREVGREVLRLHDGPLSAGAHTFALDGGTLAPGVYLARVTLGEAITTARLTITR